MVLKGVSRFRTDRNGMGAGQCLGSGVGDDAVDGESGGGAGWVSRLMLWQACAFAHRAKPWIAAWESMRAPMLINMPPMLGAGWRRARGGMDTFGSV
jgi:hypothetical protein